MNVFLSHSNRDKSLARALTVDFQVEQVEVWLDELELYGGGDLDSIRTAVEACDALLVLVSRYSAGSAWVDQEIRWAMDANIRIVPIVIDEEIPPVALADVALIDMRDPKDYRRSFYRLMAALGRGSNPEYVTAKQALRLLQSEHAPRGAFVGLGQLGIHQPTLSSNLYEWYVADASQGKSRWWLIDYRVDDLLQTWIVFDGVARPVAQYVISEADQEPQEVARSMMLLLNDLYKSANEEFTRPWGWIPGPVLPIETTFVDSDVAVSAVASELSPEGTTDRDQILLTRLRHEGWGLDRPMWTVALVEPAMEDTAATIAVDAYTGRSPVTLPREKVGAHGLQISRDDSSGDIRIDMTNHMSAMREFWIHRGIASNPETRMTGAAALREVASIVRSEKGRPWGNAIVAGMSNTGVLQTGFYSTFLGSKEDALIDTTGRAGQWIIELILADAGGPREDPGNGTPRYGYRYRRFVVTGPGRREYSKRAEDRLMPYPFLVTDSRTFEEIALSYDRATLAAFSLAPPKFRRYSVALLRLASGRYWFYRYYDDADVIRKVTVPDDERYEPFAGKPL